MTGAVPSSDQQLQFLVQLQRLFSEGDFTATYKFALLMALADLSVERPAIDDLRVSYLEIADRFIDLYWQQSVPFAVRPGEQAPGVLVQNHGAQAAVVSAIQRIRVGKPGLSLPAAKRLPEYGALRATVARTVADQPARYLQNLGGSTEPFLYERVRGGLLLKPHVPYCLRKFHVFVTGLCVDHWTSHVERNKANRSLLGQQADLQGFLFGSRREALQALAGHLRRLQDGRCFYCGQAVGEGDVDHFIPHALYRRDVVENFVLAHAPCNRSKSDALAARRHLELWLQRLQTRADDLCDLGERTGVTSGAGLMWSVAGWHYRLAYEAGSHAWIRARQFEPIDAGYIAVVDGAAVASPESSSLPGMAERPRNAPAPAG